MPSLDVLAHALRPAAREPEGALVLLHGRGTSERDLFGLLDVFDPERRLAGACPRGPLALPPGGSHWYVVPRVGFPHPDTFFASYAALGEWLAPPAPHPARRWGSGSTRSPSTPACRRSARFSAASRRAA